MITEYENTLRTLITLVIGVNDNSDYGVTPERVEQWRSKREIEEKKYQGILLEQRLIYYSDFYDIQTIINKKWVLFKDILKDKKKFDVYFKQVENYRNTISHGRKLLPFQKSLLDGIVGELKSVLVKFHNKNMDVDDYFIKLLKVSDSIGNTWENGRSNKIGMITNSIVKVGDEISIIAEAYDPKGRKITYHISNSKLSLSSDNGVFNIKFTKSMI